MPSSGRPPARFIRRGLLIVGAVFYALHFVHLAADFPGGTTWVDWSRYTDEGWYSDAAIRYSLLGHWFLPGDFNPAVALPVWPLLEALVFRFTGVSLTAVRALTVAVFGVMLLALYRLMERYPRFAQNPPVPSFAGPLAILFFCLSPFFFAFERIAILEPLLATLTVLAMLAAAYLPCPHERSGLSAGNLLPSLALGVLLPAMILTKPTAVALLPAIAYLLWAKAGYRALAAVRLALLPALLGLGLWFSYYLLLVRGDYLEDFRYLFTANEYTSFQTDPLASVVFHTLADGRWMGAVLYPLFFVLLTFLLFSRPRFFRNPLVPTLLLWVGGYSLLLGYHNNLQARYYLLSAVPVTVFVAMALDELLHSRSLTISRSSPWRFAIMIVSVLAVALPDAWQQVSFLQHPTYTFVAAARTIARIVRADPAHSPLILSVSGSELSLMTGLPSINTEFGTLDLDQRVRQYRPGWYVAWNEFEDEDMKAIAPLYQPVPVAEIAAMDDPDRNVLLLYRLDPASLKDVSGEVSGIRTRPRGRGSRFGKPGNAGHDGRSF